MNWLFLFIASLFETGWPVGLKFATFSEHKILWVIFSIIAMLLSGYFLYLAQKTIPIGTAYAVWTGIGMIGAFVFGLSLFHDTFSLLKFFGILLILFGVILLKISE